MTSFLALHDAIRQYVNDGATVAAVENGWPHSLELEEHSHAAGAAGMPCAIFRGYQGSDLVDVNANIKFIT